MSMTSVDSSLDAIVALIQQLSVDERRQLQRRLRVSGLLLPETSITDQNRLSVAPALAARIRFLSRPSSAPPPAATAAPPLPEKSKRLSLKLASPEQHDAAHSPISGKVVVGSPTLTEPTDPHAMLPLPGQAPEQPIEIIFDGGSRGNPGEGYGSYHLNWPGLAPQLVKLRFGNRMTNNEAEYDTLIAALEGVTQRLQDQGATPQSARLEIRGDSQLVINQVLGKYKVNHERLKNRRDRVRALLKHFGQWQLSHHDRSKSVAILGH